MSARNVRTTAAGLLLAGAALVAGSAGTASATADNTAFLEHVHALGFDGGANGDTTLINAGTKLCDALSDGVSLAMVQAITENTLVPKGYSISDAHRFVAYVISDLC